MQSNLRNKFKAVDDSSGFFDLKYRQTTELLCFFALSMRINTLLTSAHLFHILVCLDQKMMVHIQRWFGN